MPFDLTQPAFTEADKKVLQAITDAIPNEGYEPDIHITIVVTDKTGVWGQALTHGKVAIKSLMALDKTVNHFISSTLHEHPDLVIDTLLRELTSVEEEEEPTLKEAKSYVD